MVKFSKLCSESFHRITDRRCCVQMPYKFVPREVGEIVRYSLDQNNFGCLSNCRCCADCAQNLPGPQHLAHTVPDFIQIGSLSAEL